MKVKVICGAEAAYACISDDTPGASYSMDVRLDFTGGAHTALRIQAAHLRAQAARTLKRAERMDAAAALLEADRAANGNLPLHMRNRTTVEG